MGEYPLKWVARGGGFFQQPIGFSLQESLFLANLNVGATLTLLQDTVQMLVKNFNAFEFFLLNNSKKIACFAFFLAIAQSSSIASAKNDIQTLQSEKANLETQVQSLQSMITALKPPTVSFIHWGKKKTTVVATLEQFLFVFHKGLRTCPSGTTRVFQGTVAGPHFTHGSAGEYLCLTTSPSGNIKSPINNNRGLVYQSEFQTADAPFFQSMRDQNAVCARCEKSGVSTVHVQAGSDRCEGTGWTKLYDGSVMRCLSMHERQFNKACQQP